MENNQVSELVDFPLGCNLFKINGLKLKSKTSDQLKSIRLVVGKGNPKRMCRL